MVSKRRYKNKYKPEPPKTPAAVPFKDVSKPAGQILPETPDTGERLPRWKRELAALRAQKAGVPDVLENKPQLTIEEQAKIDAQATLIRERALAEARLAATPQPTEEQLNAAQGQGFIPPTEEEINKVIPEQGVIGKSKTFLAGVAGAQVGAGTGALIGGTVGTAVPLIGNAVGAGVGATLGGAAGFVGGAFTKITAEKRQDVKQANAVFKGAKNNMVWILNKVNSGQMSPMQARSLWNEEIRNVRAAEAALKELTDSDLDRLLSGGLDDKDTLDAFIRTLPYLEIEFQQAILNPNGQIITDFDSTLNQGEV